MEIKELTERYLAIQDLAKEDEYYLSVLEEYRCFDRKLVAALEEMASEHRDVIVDYLGCVFALYRRMLELSMTSGEKS